MDKQESERDKEEGQAHRSNNHWSLMGLVAISLFLLVIPIELEWVSYQYRWFWYGGVMLISTAAVGFLIRKHSYQYRSEIDWLRQQEYQLDTYRKQIDRAQKIAQLGLWQYFMDRDELVWSDQVKRMFGVSVDEQISFNAFMEMVHPDDRSDLRKAQQEAIDHSGVLEVSYRLIKPDGTQGYFKELGEVHRDPVKGERIFGGVILDITQQRRHELELAASEQKYRQQFEQAPYGILLTAPDGRIFEANRAAIDMLGYRLEEIQQLGRAGLVPMEHDSNKKAVTKRSDTGSFEGKMIFRHAAGTDITVHVSSRIYTNAQGKKRALVMFRDLSRIQELEASLNAEQRLSQTIISHLPGIFTVVNKDLELVRWNDNLTEKLEFTQSDVEQMTVIDFIHSQDQRKGKRAIKKVWNEGYTGVELRLQTKSGRTVPYYFTGVRFRSDGKEFMLTLGFSLEEKEHLQDEVRKSQMMFAQLFQNAPLAIALVDPSGAIQLVNEAFELIFGYQEQEVSNKNIDELLVPERMLETSKELTIGTLDGDNFQVESVRVNKAGEEVPVLVVGVPIQNNGHVESLFGMYVDISKRKRLEDEVKDLLEREKEARKQAELERNRIQEMFEQAPSAIALVEGPEHRYVYANDQYRKMTDNRVTIGEPLGDLLPELRQQRFEELLNEVYQTGETRRGTEVPVNFKQSGSDNLESRYFNYLYKPLKNASGEVENIFIEVVDVTEEFRAKEQIKKSLEEKVVLLQEVHHRVKNNLALVSSLLQLQADESDQPELEKNLREARNRIYSISKIHEILYQDENLADVSFGDYVRELVEALEKSLKPVNTSVDFKLKLQALSLSINQAIPAGLLINELVSNAYEHAFRGRSEGEVQIKMEKVDGQILLNIQDNGVGLPKDFELSTGNTLGWTLIQTLVKQLHGQIDVDSSAQGTGIQIRFPHQLNDDAMLN